MKASLTFQQGTLTVMFTNERNPVSAKYNECISILVEGEPEYIFPIKELGLDFVGLSQARSLPTVIKKATRLLPEELREPVFRSEDYRLLITGLRESIRNGTSGFDDYLNQVSFKYERNPNVKLENNKLRFRLYTDEENEKAKISISFIKEANRKYRISFNIVYKLKGVKGLVHHEFGRRNDPVSNFDILAKQINQWMEQFITDHDLDTKRFDQIKASVLLTVDRSKEDLSEILERFNNGWEL